MQKYLTVVSAVLSDAKRNEIIQKNPARMIDLPDTEKREQFIPSEEQAEQLITAFLEEATLFERQCKNEPMKVDKSISLAAYTEMWLKEIAPNKLAKSTLARDKQDIDRFMPYMGGYKLTDLKPEHFRNLYAELRKQKNSVTGKPLSECTVEGVHACLCGILSDAMEGGFLSHNPAWRTYKYTGKKKKKQNVADEETTQKLVAALEEESIKYETYFKLIIATGMRRGGVLRSEMV